MVNGVIGLISINLFILSFYMNISIYYNRYSGIRLVIKLLKENYKKVLFYIYCLNYGSNIINLKV